MVKNQVNIEYLFFVGEHFKQIRNDHVIISHLLRGESIIYSIKNKIGKFKYTKWNPLIAKKATGM